MLNYFSVILANYPGVFLSQGASTSFFCDKCNKGFTKKNSMYRHKKHTCEFREKEEDKLSMEINERMAKLEKTKDAMGEIFGFERF